MYRFILLFTFLFISKGISAQIRYVDASAASNGNGLSWSSAYNNLHDAISLSPAGTQIWLKEGTYKPSADTTGALNPADAKSKTFFINKDIQLIGGFGGDESAASQANATLHPTYLSGDVLQTADITDDVYHILYFSTVQAVLGITNACIIKNLTIRHSYGFSTISNSNNNLGGGAYFNAIGLSKNMSPIFEQVNWENNAARSGGALYFDIKGSTTSPQFIKCNFINNKALGANPTVGTGAGGAIRFNTNDGLAAAVFEGCYFKNNIAGSAGAIYNILFAGNSYLTISKCIFEKNNSSGSGGVMYNCSNGSMVRNIPTLVNCAFIDNMAAANGGVIYNIANAGESSANILQCTFMGNRAASGAAIYSRANIGATSSTTFKNSIVWNQLANHNEAINLAGGPSTIAFLNSIISDGVTDGTITGSYGCSFQNCIESNPLFVAINNPAGSDGTFGTNDDGLNLAPGSAAIDAGDNTVVNSFLRNNQSKIAAVVFDIKGADRLQGTAVDLGAYESAPIVTLPLRLLSFDVKQQNQKHVISWATERNVDIKGFIVEHSHNGATFEQIGNIEAKNNYDETNYNYENELKQSNNSSYYRLKIVESDGKYFYSKVIFIENTDDEKIVLGPNPTNNELHVNSNKAGVLQILSVTGQIIKNFEIGPGPAILWVGDITSGLYIMNFQNQEKVRFQIVR